MEERKKWLSAIEKFVTDINSIVSCPNCEKGNLIKDVAFNDNQISKGGERFIECRACGKFEIVLYRNPPENWYLNNE
ncbi:hypothetical protein [Flavobacterium sp. FlaQc-47]|uniref:hypothetical protein n=1 Tax=Flavobacterium sp. FlaQc-47 TaxID=3374180 RepID=UPI003757842E